MGLRERVVLAVNGFPGSLASGIREFNSGATTATTDSSDYHHPGASGTVGAQQQQYQQRFEVSQDRSAEERNPHDSSARMHHSFGDAPSSAFYRVSRSAAVSSSLKMPLSSQELGFLDMLSTRPGNDYPEALEHWKATLVAMTEKSKPRWFCAAATNTNTNHHHTTECFTTGPSYNNNYCDDTSSVLPASSSFDMDGFDISDFPSDFLLGEGNSAVV
jgi:hypothetical protein